MRIQRFRSTAFASLLIASSLVVMGCKKKEAPPAPASVSAARPLPVPPTFTAPPADFVTGADKVRLGMTEAEFSAALGGPPTQRKSFQDGVDAKWAITTGNTGSAVGRFYAGQLVLVTFGPDPSRLSLPRISQQTARALTADASLVRRAVEKQLKLSEIETMTGSAGGLINWATTAPQGSSIENKVWAWEIEPGGQALVVGEDDGHASQPVIRPLK